MSPDRLQFMIRAIERALAGDPDPFRLRKKGRPAHSRYRKEVAALWVELLCQRGASVEKAVAAVSERTGIAERILASGKLRKLARDSFTQWHRPTVILREIEQVFGCKNPADLLQ